MTWIGESKRILGIDVTKSRDQDFLTISQASYCGKLIKRFNLSQAKPVTIPIAQHFKLSSANSPNENDLEHKQYMEKVSYSQVVGIIMYLMISTRPDLSYLTSLVSRYMSNPGRRH